MRVLLPVALFGAVVSGGLGHQWEAHAHATLESSQPADGATLDASPGSVTLTFTEEPEPSLSSAQLVDQAGRVVRHLDATMVPGDLRTIRFAVAELPEGVYTLIWRVVSRIDGHATAGLVSFGVGVPPLAVPPQHTAATVEEIRISGWEVAGRWIFLSGLVLLLGTAIIGVTAFLAFPNVVRRAMVLGLILAAAGLGVLGTAQREMAQASVTTFFGTSVGRAVIWRGVALMLAAVGVALTGFSGRVGPVLAAAGAAGTMLAEVAAGHAGNTAVGWPQVAAQWLHVVAVGVWIGGLAALLLGIRGAPDEQKASAVRGFSQAAGIALIVVVATGTIRAIDELDRLGDLFSTSYGRVLILKVTALLILVVLGGVNRYRNVPRAAGRLIGLRRISRVELVLACGVLAASALLTSLAPPAPVSAAPPVSSDAPSLSLEASDFATSIQALLNVSPGRAGPNRFEVLVTDYDTGRPMSARRVTLRFAYLIGPAATRSSLELAAQGPGTFAAVGPNIALEGLWRLVLTVEGADDSAEVGFHVATPCAATALGTGRPQIYTLAVDGIGSVQGLLGGVGGDRYQIHFTFLGEDDRELRIPDRPTISAWRPGEEPAELRVTRLDRGHFVSEARLDQGAWYFQAVAATAGELHLWGCFEEEV